MIRVRRVGLVGCVKAKASQAMPSRDLYTSALFAGRRRFVELSCDEWWVLSALHGLVHPSEVLEPYDVTLKKAGRAQLRAWSAGVLEAIDVRIGPQPGVVFEIHAGSEYRDHGIMDGLRLRGCAVEIPTEGMRIGSQLQFYKQVPSS